MLDGTEEHFVIQQCCLDRNVVRIELVLDLVPPVRIRGHNLANVDRLVENRGILAELKHLFADGIPNPKDNDAHCHLRHGSDVCARCVERYRR